jgi:uncharacterized OB-fold protein
LITVVRCSNGHAFFEVYERCPRCGGRMEPITAGDAATLVSVTTVRVNPAGRPFRLGLAEVECGARTLCIVEDKHADIGSTVRLQLVDGRWSAAVR